MNNWIRQITRKLIADVGFYYLPTRIIAVIPKTALEYNTHIVSKSEDEFNIYLEFNIASHRKESKKLTGDKNPGTLV